ncbi:MAG: hypothetical protein MZU97_14900 [Bacillus subtilis]|nr:hypothetical protein [Bacillus subtilis]
MSSFGFKCHIFFVPEDIVNHVVLVSAVALVYTPELAAAGFVLVHLRIQRGKEKVLKNRLVIGALVLVCEVELGFSAFG